MYHARWVTDCMSHVYIFWPYNNNWGFQFSVVKIGSISSNTLAYSCHLRECCNRAFGAEQIVLSEIFTSFAMLLRVSLLDVLIYCFIELVQLLSQEINRQAKLCIKLCKSTKPPIYCYKMSDTVHSIVNPLCVFDHLVSDHHILVIENRFRKKLRCRVWFHFTKENSIGFEDVWSEGINFDSLAESRGRSTLIEEEKDTTPSEHFSIYGLIALTFLSMWVLELEYTF